MCPWVNDSRLEKPDGSNRASRRERQFHLANRNRIVQGDSALPRVIVSLSPPLLTRVTLPGEVAWMPIASGPPAYSMTSSPLALSLIMLDIDWFKRFNDNYGHEVGNQVLRKLVEVVKACIRDVDILCRYGGEEFVVILPQTPEREALKLARRIRSEVENFQFGGRGMPNLRVTVSVGVTSYPENGLSEEELISAVDQAMYRAKGSGKNTVCTV